MTKKILITERFAITAFSMLKAYKDFELVIDQSPTEEDLKTSEGLIIRSRTKITSEFLEKTPNLKVIISSTSGYDHIDLESTAKRNIKVYHTPEANAQSTAELTWLLILSAARDLNLSLKMIDEVSWEKSKLQGVELFGKTLGVIGLGRVGLRVALIARAFGMHVVAYDPYKEDEAFKTHLISRVGYTELLKLSHVISFHVPYTKETHNMMNRKLFNDCHHGVILINASRGQVINENDLIEGLDSGVFSRVALDVFAKEPLSKDSNLFDHPKVVKTPHIGATTNEAFETSSLHAAQKCIDFFKGLEVSDELPPQSPWWHYQFRKTTSFN